MILLSPFTQVSLTFLNKKRENVHLVYIKVAMSKLIFIDIAYICISFCNKSNINKGLNNGQWYWPVWPYVLLRVHIEDNPTSTQRNEWMDLKHLMLLKDATKSPTGVGIFSSALGLFLLQKNITKFPKQNKLNRTEE